ncbi:MAG: hypothetical protein MUF01_09300 [Bryobacterales bacterium]|jgi:hypothetical protein|nr:hypothetical protein [Bryobacterales bacterium]
MNLNQRLKQHGNVLLACGLAAGVVGAMGAAAQSVVDVTGGRLAVTAPSGDRSVKVEVQGRTARLFGFPGIPDGAAYGSLSGVSVQTGSGNDQVEVAVESAESFDLRVDTGIGQATSKVKWKVLAGAGSPAINIEIGGAGAQERLAVIEVDSESSFAAVNIETSPMTEVAAKVISSNVSDFLRVGFGATAPKTSLEVVSAAASLETEVRGGPTGAADELVYKIVQTRPAIVSTLWSIDTGAGNDKLEALIDAPGSTVTNRGSILARGGDDQVKLESNAFGTATGVTINGGAGNDQLEQLVKGRFLPSQTLQTTMLGGDGADSLVLTTDTGIFGTGLPNDLFPIINCGAGVDTFNAFGQIRGCESRQ